MAFSEDVSVFLDTDDFAETGVFTPSGFPHTCSKSVNISVIFENRYVELADNAGSFPTALGATSDFSDGDIGFGATFNISGETQNYTIIEVQPDGTGMSLMVLNKI